MQCHQWCSVHNTRRHTVTHSRLRQHERCGKRFSTQWLQILRRMDVPFETVDILTDDLLRAGMKEYSQVSFAMTPSMLYLSWLLWLIQAWSTTSHFKFANAHPAVLEKGLADPERGMFHQPTEVASRAQVKHINDKMANAFDKRNGKPTAQAFKQLRVSRALLSSIAANLNALRSCCSIA